MPELPEVEIIRRGLQSGIVGKIIKRFKANPPKIFSGKKSDLVGKKVLSVERCGKIIVLSLSDAVKVIIHLKMTGQLIFDPGREGKRRIAGGHPSGDWIAELPNKHTRAIFSFGDKSTLYFNDLRKFGYIKCYKKKAIPETAEIGVDALDKWFSAKYLLEKSRKKTTEVKKFIMDQKIVAGIGNIYSDEALFCAGILPSRRINKISLGEFKELVECLKEVLREGIKRGGSSYRNFVNSSGKKGKMQNYFNVYGRAGKVCSGCGENIIRKKIGGRSSCFCPVCQK